VHLNRINVQYVDIDVTATLRDGTTPAPLAGVDVALIPPRTTPTAVTVWSPTTYADGTATVLIAGPDAGNADAMVVPSPGADLWIRVVDSPEVDAALVERIVVD
jgi:hypothetical protein